MDRATPHQPLSIEVNIRGDRAALVTMAGDVDLAECERLEALVRLGETSLDLVVDLSGVTYLDSVGIGVLIRARDACVERGHSLMIRVPSSAVRQVLDIAAVDASLRIVNKPVPGRTRRRTGHMATTT